MARITDFSDLFKFVHAELPECPAVLFNQHVIQGGRQFCKRTRVWRESLTAYNLVADDKTYTLAPIVGATTYVAQIEAVVEVRWNTAAGVTAGTSGNVQNWRTYGFNPNTSVLTLETAPTESITSGLDVVAVLVPDLSATDMADWVLNIYAEPILAYAMYTLKRIPNVAWTDQAGSQLAYREYVNGVSKAKADIAREYRDGSIGVQQ